MNELAELDLKIENDAIAIVNGEALTDLPQDLYIPPDALEVFLETFEGPLDLLLYLIKKQNVDILDIPIAEITRQYMSYVEMMKSMRLELAGEYLVMAAMLAEIKSRMMLPKIVSDEEEDDPRAELIRRLQEYERFKNAAADIDALPRCERDIYLVEPVRCERVNKVADVDVVLPDLLRALKDVMKRAELFNHHQIKREALSVRERMTLVLNAVSVNKGKFVDFAELFNPEEGRRGIVVTFLAILELIKGALIEVVQTEVYGPIHVKAR
ncbi:MAG TPA: segregation/condensation protein A [Gammaproteobacteria bacterium]|nr:segregation/condensation protein A [Gammaproteobacteria bacterium]